MTLNAAADAGRNHAYWVTVLDLEGLKADAKGPRTKAQTAAKVAEFLAGKGHPMSVLRVAADSTPLAVATRGGNTRRSSGRASSPQACASLRKQEDGRSLALCRRRMCAIYVAAGLR